METIVSNKRLYVVERINNDGYHEVNYSRIINGHYVQIVADEGCAKLSVMVDNEAAHIERSKVARWIAERVG